MPTIVAPPTIVKGKHWMSSATCLRTNQHGSTLPNT